MHSVRLADSIDAPSTESYVEIDPDVPDNIGFANKVTAIGYIKLILPPLFAGTLSVVPHCLNPDCNPEKSVIWILPRPKFHSS